MNAAAAAERVARESYGRLLALLAARTRDVAAAEDALADAFAAALSAWPRGAVPDNPEAWLFAAARRKLIDAARRRKTASEGEQQIVMGIEELEAEMGAADAPDRRLGLMFACAHPAIEESVRTPLMLQAVLGFSAERIAAAFLVEPAAMGQRLVRAKKKIRDAGIGFDVPEPAAWRARFAAALDAIYAAYGAGWSDPLGADPERRGLAEEAIWLARVLVSQLKDEPEPLGLLSLMLHLEARRPARRDREGRFVPLDEQDVSLWRRELIAEAETLLRQASVMKRPGRYQLEAAIQSAHATRAWRGEADWDAIVLLYTALAELTGSPVARLNAAAAIARRDGPAPGLAAAEAVARQSAALNDYQPYWALKADLCARLGRAEAARAAYDEAIARESDAAVIAFLRSRRDGL
ncbi:MAG: RNA polymerase subunit sigma-70 [Proteobacteria bacterium HN_bin10]|nr:MAG: RNA polymerase subunit sigma-70 [Proteobacteria bacterium HN_bin10]